MVVKRSAKPVPAHLKGKQPKPANHAALNKRPVLNQKQPKLHTVPPTLPISTPAEVEDLEPDQKMNTNFLFEFDGGSLVKQKHLSQDISHVVNSFAQEFDSDDEDVMDGDGEEEERVMDDELMQDGSESESSDSDEESEMGLEIASDNESETDERQESRDVVKDKRIATYFAPAPSTDDSVPISAFTQLKLSRPILRAVAAIGYSKPTEIQAKAIPLAMQGKDLCGAAVTGSGKTAAFMIPILERLLHRPKSIPATRVLVIAPTRELGLQIHAVTKSLSLFTDISACLCVGGLQSKLQEQELRMRPDIVICTPGRLIDHLKNTPGFTLDMIDVLVMDEADRMLEDGFREELTEIINSCPRTRQTMLFSATMTENVDDLIRLSLNTPIRLFVDENTAMTKRLVQEFVRVRELPLKIPLLLTLVKTYPKETIIFFKSKVATHETKVLFQTLGLRAAELHGDLNQTERIKSLELFKQKQVDFLLCTDLASRGIDVPNVKAVINFDMPSQYSHYIHRCGRTARAGQKGTAISFIQESDRSIMKLVIKKVSGDVKQRIPCSIATAKIAEGMSEVMVRVKATLEQEKIDKGIDKDIERIERIENGMKYEGEIMARAKREWFQTEREKEASKELALKDHQVKMGIAPRKQKRNKFEGLSRRKKRNLECREDDAKSIANQKRSAKNKKAALKPEKMRKIISK